MLRCSVVIKLKPLPPEAKIIRIRRIRVKRGVSVTAVWYRVKNAKRDRPPKGVKTRATSIVYNLRYFGTFKQRNKELFRKLVRAVPEKKRTECHKRVLR